MNPNSPHNQIEQNSKTLSLRCHFNTMKDKKHKPTVTVCKSGSSKPNPDFSRSLSHAYMQEFGQVPVFKYAA
ncbi:hypothetical protein N665_0872s0009 [Sinapis alba]|nr:hypothetical protein N665_0872s0009 [Sinapis alba]